MLRAAGGLAAIRDALIDDCALAKALKRHGPISIALTERVRSIRAYPAIDDIRRMVSRTAYAQLRYSPLLLAGTVFGLALTYLAPVAARDLRRRRRAIHRHFHLAADGLRVPPDAAVLSACRPLGLGAAGHRGDVYGVHAGFRLSACARPRRHVEGPRASQYFGIAMNEARRITVGQGPPG